MSNISDTLRECHRIVWDARAILAPYWPTPSTEDALLFAFTELGEAVDAHLRSKPQYARNRDKDLSVLDELADCALMLLTALGENYLMRWDHVSTYRGEHDWGEYFQNMHLAQAYAAQDWEYTECLVSRIATHPGMDLPARLTARLDRIKAKRLPNDYAELERHWPDLEAQPDGVDVFAHLPVAGLPE